MRTEKDPKRASIRFCIRLETVSKQLESTNWIRTQGFLRLVCLFFDERRDCNPPMLTSTPDKDDSDVKGVQVRVQKIRSLKKVSFGDKLTRSLRCYNNSKILSNLKYVKEFWFFFNFYSSMRHVISIISLKYR